MVLSLLFFGKSGLKMRLVRQVTGTNLFRGRDYKWVTRTTTGRLLNE